MASSNEAGIEAEAVQTYKNCYIDLQEKVIAKYMEMEDKDKDIEKMENEVKLAKNSRFRLRKQLTVLKQESKKAKKRVEFAEQKKAQEEKKAQEAEEKLQKDHKMGLQLMQLVGHYRDRRQERSKQVLKDAMAGTNLRHSPAIGA